MAISAVQRSANNHLKAQSSRSIRHNQTTNLTPTLRVLRFIAQLTAKPRSRRCWPPKGESGDPYTISLPAH